MHLTFAILFPTTRNLIKAICCCSEFKSNIAPIGIPFYDQILGGDFGVRTLQSKEAKTQYFNDQYAQRTECKKQRVWVTVRHSIASFRASDSSSFDRPKLNKSKSGQESKKQQNRLSHIFEKKISQNSADPEMLGDIYYNLMSSNVTSPDMRIAWLETLSLFHEQVCF